MTTTALDVLNLGLFIIGEPAVTNLQYPISAASWASNVVTLTIGTHPFAVGNTILVENNSTSAWDGFQTVTAVTSNSVSFANTTNASTSGGDVRAGMPTDGSKGSQIFTSAWIPSILFNTLASYPWDSASEEAVLLQPELTPTAATANGTTITLTVGPNTLSATQTIYLNGSVITGGNATTWDGTYVLTATTATTISFASTLTGTPTTFGEVTWAPLMDYSYVYALPSNIVRAVKVNNIAYSNFYTYTMTGGYYPIGDTMPPFRIEGANLLSDELMVILKYVAWDDVFFQPPQDQNIIDLLAARVAMMLAMPLTRQPAVVTLANNAWMAAYRHARMVAAMQGTPEAYQEDNWVTGRL